MHLAPYDVQVNALERLYAAKVLGETEPAKMAVGMTWCPYWRGLAAAK